MPKPDDYVNIILLQASQAIEKGLEADTPEARSSFAALAAACATVVIATTTAAALDD